MGSLSKTDLHRGEAEAVQQLRLGRWAEKKDATVDPEGRLRRRVATTGRKYKWLLALRGRIPDRRSRCWNRECRNPERANWLS